MRDTEAKCAMAILNKDNELYEQYRLDSIEINNKIIEILDERSGKHKKLEVFAMELFQT
jgi:hypothetical protein